MCAKYFVDELSDVLVWHVGCHESADQGGDLVGDLGFDVHVGSPEDFLRFPLAGPHTQHGMLWGMETDCLWDFHPVPTQTINDIWEVELEELCRPNPGQMTIAERIAAIFKKG